MRSEHSSDSRSGLDVDDRPTKGTPCASHTPLQPLSPASSWYRFRHRDRSGAGRAPGPGGLRRRRPLPRQMVAAGDRPPLVLGRDLRAFYTRIDEKTIGVDNQCTGPTGMRGGVIGRATVVDTKTNAQLSVRFPQTPASINPTGRRTTSSPTSRTARTRTVRTSTRSSVTHSRLGIPALARQGRVRLRTASADQGDREGGVQPCTFLVSPTTGGRSDYSPLCIL